MKLILFYHQNTARIGENFKNSILKNMAGAIIEIVQTIKGLENRIAQTPIFFEDEIYIVLVDSKSRLLELSVLGMEDKHVILILPEESEECMRIAMQMCPRFITRISDDYENIHLVLEQIAGKKNKNRLK